ncbi:hypothetical protein C1645_879467 [Glomus cerebriforme]|uniref:Hsp70 family protein n=1 Tax=Glomus cerebriforme TaxID=658196 RepID=A0A397SGP7_9GLOM|nr:hypothetical protein C1645_879467 [Glomus cerebriforme]
MTSEHSKNNSSENLFPDKPHEVIGKLGIGFNKLNDKLINLLEENQSLKQQYKILQQKNQEILRINEDINEKHQETLRINEDLNKKYQEILHINTNLKEKLQEKDEKFEKLQQNILNLEKHKNEELQQLEMFYQNLEKNLEILESDEINENYIKILKENKYNYIINEPTTVDKGPGKDISRRCSDIKVVVGLDFGTKYSGFSYCHVDDKQNYVTNESWPELLGQFRTNTALQYDDEYCNVVYWGFPALAERPSRRNKIQKNKTVELFKLHLGNLPDNLKPKLPIDYKKAITDYLREIGKFIKIIVSEHWEISCFDCILLVLSIPAEYSEKEKAIMRECVYNADLISDKYSEKLQFITECDATAIYCMKNALQEHAIGMTFMVVNCNNNILDLITRKLIRDKPLELGKITGYIKDFCGSESIDKEFIKFLRKKLGNHAIDLLIERCYVQYQYMVQEFCQHAKLPFTGDDMEFFYELDIDEVIPILLQYINKETREIMEENEMVIKIKYDDIKKMFDLVIDRIIHLIHIQLSNNQETCSVLFLVGEFSENKYFQKRIKQEFQHKVQNISVPQTPTAAISRGAVIYGSYIDSDLNKLEKYASIIHTRVLKYTYGIKFLSDYKEDVDPPQRKNSDGKIYKFRTLVQRGTEVEIGKILSFEYFYGLTNQTSAKCEVYYTREYSAEYPDEPGMKSLGIINFDFPDTRINNRSIYFELSFNEMEITVSVKNKTNGQLYMTTFDHPIDVC